VCGEEKIILYWADYSRVAKAGKNLLYRHNVLNEPTKEGPLSFVLYKTPFASVSTFSRGHPSLVSGGEKSNRSKNTSYFEYNICVKFRTIFILVK
jgi:hypothetical protein